MSKLKDALKNLDEYEVYTLVDEKIKAEVSPIDIIKECNEGMVAVGELFSEGKYFISQLIFSSEIFKQVMNKLDPYMGSTDTSDLKSGKVVIGTVKNDIHDIGKNIVITLLRGSGFEVTDLGVDVEPQKFVETLKETQAKVLGLSALLNFTYPEMKKVVEAVHEAGLQDKVKVIIGGAPVNEQVREYVGADYYATDAVFGVNLCKKIYSLS